MTNEYLEYGLELPNGTVHWGQYQNRSLVTEEDRSKMALTLRLTAQQCGFEESEFVNRYRWVGRTVTPLDTKWVIDDPEVAPALKNEQPTG